MEDIFKNILKGNVLVIGIGNILRGDDGAGCVLISMLKEKKVSSCLDASNAPENYIGAIAKESPDTVLVVDAVHLGLPAGEYKILEDGDIAKSGLTTHDISPAFFIEALKTQTSANIYILGIQPEKVGLGDEMSAAVENGLRKISEYIAAVLRRG